MGRNKQGEFLRSVKDCFQQAVLFPELARYIPNLRIDEVEVHPRWAGRIRVSVRGCGDVFDVVPRSYGPVWTVDVIVAAMVRMWNDCGRPERNVNE